MSTSGRLSRNERGTGSIIGAAFLLLILLSGFSAYALSVRTQIAYRGTLEEMDQLDNRRDKEEITFEEVSLTLDQRLNITVKNTGSYPAHLIWLGVLNRTSTPEDQRYFSQDIYLNPGETATNIGSNITLNSDNHYIIQIVTELGNLFIYDLYPITITGPDTIPHKTKTIYTIKIPTTTGTPVPIYFSIYANGSKVEFSGISNPDWLHTDANGECTVEIMSTNVEGETFILYVMAGDLVGQKRIIQEPK
ncbi:MAG: hypothetical protein ACETVR_01880 [Candidatus Bathyarchaeia archaeon]